MLGDPLTYTRSPELHRAGLAALGIAGASVALRTSVDALGERLRSLAAEGCTGVNLTHPLKEAAIAHLASVAPAARASRSVNTVGFAAAGWWGDTTDGDGFLDLLGTLDRDPASERVLLFGSGGASRSLGLALAQRGVESLVVVSRDPERARAAWSGIASARLVAAGSEPLREAAARATLVVNGTPRSGPREPVAPEETAAGALLVDLTYGPEPTAWVAAGRAAGRRSMDGLGLLVHQARRSLQLWTGRELGIEPLARAVGWRP